MATFITDNVNNLLVQFLEDAYPDVFYQARPFFDRIKKKSGVGGESVKIPLPTSAGGGQGGDFVSALANAQPGGAKRVAFTCEPAKGFGIMTLENSEVPFTETPESAMDILTEATKNAMENAAANFEAMVFSDGHGTLGTISTATNTTGHIWRLVLTQGTDVFHFALGNVLVSKATPATGSLDTGTATVVGTNPENASILVDVSTSGMTPTAGHVLGLQGQMLASTGVVTWPGVFAWNPPITSRTNGAVGDTFLGVDRTESSNVVAVSGWAIDARNQGSLVQAVNNLCGLMANLKLAKPDTAIVNPTVLAQICNELETQARNDLRSFNGIDVLYSGVEIMTPAGKIEVLAESTMPANQIFVTKCDTWTFAYPDKVFKPASLKGNMLVEDYATNSTRIAVICAGFLYSTNPAASGNILIA